MHFSYSHGNQRLLKRLYLKTKLSFNRLECTETYPTKFGINYHLADKHGKLIDASEEFELKDWYVEEFSNMYEPEVVINPI